MNSRSVVSPINARGWKRGYAFAPISLSDTVAAEEKISERRSELNDLEKRSKKLESGIEYALVEIQIIERYQAHLDLRTALTSSDLRNSLIEGIEGVILSLGAVLGFLLHYGLALSVWIGVLYWPSAVSGAVIAANIRCLHPPARKSRFCGPLRLRFIFILFSLLWVGTFGALATLPLVKDSGG
jgi:uncharacterized protein DUF4349